MSYCDMCGQRFRDPYDRRSIIISGREKGKREGGDYLYDIDTLLPQELDSYDVCENCFHKVQAFMRKEKPNEERDAE